VVGCFEHGTEPLCSIKEGEFLDSLKDYQLLQEKKFKIYLYVARTPPRLTINDGK